MVHETLDRLGFTDFFRATINSTARRMHEQIDNDPDLADRVLDEIRDSHAPDPVDKKNYEQVMQDWVYEQAAALHREWAKAFLTPFKVMANLFE